MTRLLFSVVISIIIIVYASKKQPVVLRAPVPVHALDIDLVLVLRLGLHHLLRRSVASGSHARSISYVVRRWMRMHFHLDINFIDVTLTIGIWDGVKRMGDERVMRGCVSG